MVEYTLEKIAAILDGKTLGDIKNQFRYISTDSRRLSEPTNTLYIAIKGERHNGHNYIDHMLKKGVKCFLISETPKNINAYPEAGFFIVKDTVKALQNLASFHRTKFTGKVASITGSNGKTITKEWISTALALKNKVVRSPKSYNSQIGVPLSVWLLSPNNQWGIFEAGISKPGEMEKLEKIIQPNAGIITNIGEAHQENFSNLDEKISEKLKLFINCSEIYYCSDHKLINKSILNSEILKTKKLFGWSLENNSKELNFTIKKKTNNSTFISFEKDNNTYTIELKYTDRASIENCLHVANFLIHNNFTIDEVKIAISSLLPVAMRLEQVRGTNNCILINDSYNSDINSLGIALDFLNQQPKSEKSLILSDIQQSGLSAKELYLNVSRLVNQVRLKRFIGIGSNISEFTIIQKQTECFYFENTESFLSSELVSGFKNEAILIKGARIFKFEKIVNTLSEKSHTTVLEINLNNMVDNLNYFRSLLQPQTRLMVMVKALSYGSGSFEIANLLQHEKVDYLGVAFTDEGIQLRQSGIHLPIMVMSPNKEDFKRLIEYNLEPEIYSLSMLGRFINDASALQIQDYPVHLKVDTGMHRLGFRMQDIDTMLSFIKSTDCIKIKSVFTHLAASDSPNQDDFTLYQLNSFDEIYDKIRKITEYAPLRHILNSAGIERFPLIHYEMVRLGIGLHGISANNKELNPVSTLKTHISQIKEIPSGDTIGYNRRGVAFENTKIAIIPIGYADGLDRKFGNGNGSVIINKQKAPFIGDVCMDMSMIDITGINCHEEDEVIIFGKENPIANLALKINTIPYEILTNVSSRVKRVYFKD